MTECVVVLEDSAYYYFSLLGVGVGFSWKSESIRGYPPLYWYISDRFFHKKWNDPMLDSMNVAIV